jgi:hypothetical protein
MYLETYYSHQPRTVTMDEIPTNFKAQEMQIAKWTLTEDQQLMKFNLGTNTKP